LKLLVLLTVDSQVKNLRLYSETLAITIAFNMSKMLVLRAKL